MRLYIYNIYIIYIIYIIIYIYVNMQPLQPTMQTAELLYMYNRMTAEARIHGRITDDSGQAMINGMDPLSFAVCDIL